MNNPDWHDNYMAFLERQEREREEAAERFFLGLDLGQAADFTALALIRRELVGEDREPHCSIPYLKRWQLGSAYPEIVDEIAGRLARSPDTTRLVIDGTGVGRAVVDLFLTHPLLESRSGRIIPVTITAGDHETYNDGYRRVPKRNLVGSTQVLLQSGRLKIAADSPLTQTLVTELQNFRVKITASANDTYEAWRDGQHDDLVLACALACWAATSKSVNHEFTQSTWFR